MAHAIRIVVVAGGLIAWAAGAGVATADDGPAQRAQRLRFDTDKEAWVELPKPEPGTPEGDLAIAGALHADGRHKSARRAVKAWIKVHGATSEHYPAALLLQARVEKALKNYYVAYELLEQLIGEFAGTEIAADALMEEFNIAEVFLSGVRRKVWGIRLLKSDDVGLDILDRISTEHPDSEIAEGAIKTKADYFFRQGDFSLAEMEYARLLRDFPQSRYTRYALRRSADGALASFGGILFDDAPLIEAEERFNMYAAQYPGHAEQEGIGLIVGDIREKRAAKEYEIGRYYARTGHTPAAEFYYQSTMTHWPDTIAAAKAAAALNAPTDGVEPPADGSSNE